MICYSVFGCCSTWWAEPGKQFTWISSIMNNVYGFFSPSVILGYILLIQRYPFKTCVFIGQEARYLDSGCSVIAWVIYGYLFCWTLLWFPSNVDELVRVISPLVFCASPWFFSCVCMHKNINFIAVFWYRMHFSLFIYHDCVYDYKIFITLSISI